MAMNANVDDAAVATMRRPLMELVPGGCHTYSKGPDQFPTNAPETIVRGAGARVLGIDERWYIDWAMGLTSVSLGHAHPEVNDALARSLADGVNFTRPAELERVAAGRFLELFGGDMVKFCKNGSTATTAAVKLARAYTGRTRVAIPAEHPFFSYDDWFVGTTATDLGIPEEHKRLTHTFHYNDVESLAQLLEAHRGEFACVMMEPVKFSPPAPGFLQGVRELCDQHGVVLVLDEMVSGLKWALRGGQEYFGVTPDLSTWGKGLANGFSVCALSGKREIMELGGSLEQGPRVFLISTTHGAESTGLAAMLATVEIILRDDVIAANWRAGAALQKRLRECIQAHGLAEHLKVDGYPCLFVVGWSGLPEINAFEWKTLLQQELIAERILFTGMLYPTPSHTPEICDETVEAFDIALARVASAWRTGSVSGFLRGPVTRPVFRKSQEALTSG
jgi:glutamate-1-semialdehyde 2,1-aminomutase